MEIHFLLDWEFGVVVKVSFCTVFCVVTIPQKGVFRAECFFCKLYAVA